MKSSISRRAFVRNGIAATIGARGLRLAAQAPPLAATLAIDLEKTGRTMPDNFTGLSYESAQLADPTFFSAQNKALVEQVRNLGPKGQLRLGGSLSNFTVWWNPATTPHRPAITPAIAEGQKQFEWILTTPSVSEEKYAVIKPEAISALRSFCDATGWTAVYGLNLGLGTAEQAAAEAACVLHELGPRLDAFAVGNETDRFSRHRRPSTWIFDDYWREYTNFVRAVRATAPHAPFSGPDSAGSEWLQPYAEHAGKDPVFLSTHMYHMGHAGDPGINAEKLLTPNGILNDRLTASRKASAVAGVPVRMTELGSCSHGGQPGASDAYASALWAADLMLQAAREGLLGINMHGGGMGLYSPIVRDQHAGFSARPVTYGMRFANEFAGATFVDNRFTASSEANVFAHTARKRDALLVSVVNKSASPAEIALTGPKGIPRRMLVLTGPAIDAVSGTTLKEHAPDHGKTLALSPYSAKLYEWKLA